MPVLQSFDNQVAQIALVPLGVSVVLILVWSAILVHSSRSREQQLRRINTELRRREAALTQLAITDPVTGLYNRFYLFQTLRAEFGRAQRYHHPLSLIMVDVDHFKQVNDRYGHGYGDFVLREVAEILRGNLRASDVVCRYGGEEFAIILPETDEQGARLVAERNRLRVREHGFFDGMTTTNVTISQGIAAYPAAAIHAGEDLLRYADAAMYAAKRHGRDHIAVASTALSTQINQEADGHSLTESP